MSAEEPLPQDQPTPPPPAAAPPPAPAPTPPTEGPAAHTATPAALPARSAIRVAIVLGLLAALMLTGYFIARSGLISGGKQGDAYTVQAFTPPEPLISAHERILAHAEPDEASPTVVMFGAGAGLHVNGRVSRGLGNDWYRIEWNGRVAFVRQQDTVAGEEAPPQVAERPKPEEPEEKPEEPDVADNADIPEFPPLPPAGGFELSDVRWARAPNARDFARFYPDRALEQNRSGRVVLSCDVSGSGALDCSVAEEDPEGWGFGQAAVAIARQARVEPTTPDGRSVEGGHLRLPLVFRPG